MPLEEGTGRKRGPDRADTELFLPSTCLHGVATLWSATLGLVPSSMSVCLSVVPSMSPSHWVWDSWALTSLTGLVALNEREGQGWPCLLLPLLMLQELH